MIENLMSLLKENQFLVAGLGVSGFGLLSFWLRDVPIKIGRVLKKQLTTDLIINNCDKVFYEILTWIKEENKDKNFRTLKLCNGKYGSSDNVITSMGYGFHIVKYKHHFLFLTYNRDADGVSDKIKETITLTKLGRRKKLFEEIIKHIETKNVDKNKLELYTMDHGWDFSKRIRKRNIDSVFIEKQKKYLIINNLNKFIKNENWYLNSGIPYQYGILLHGSPGTGKTSLIKMIATVLNYNIYYLAPSKMNSIDIALSECPEKSIVVIEDIDTNNKVKERSDNTKEDILDMMSPINLSDILNSIDGLKGVHGRLLICTTNHIKTLDKALIRPGRFDLLVEIGYVNKEILKHFMNFHFPNEKTNVSKLKLKRKLTVATLQNMLLLGYDKNKILKEISVKNITVSDKIPNNQEK